jgi:hypothetical protein
MNTTTNKNETVSLTTGENLAAYLHDVRRAFEVVDEARAAEQIYCMIRQSARVNAACQRSHRTMYSVVSYYAQAFAKEFTTPEDRAEFELTTLDCVYRLLD